MTPVFTGSGSRIRLGIIAKWFDIRINGEARLGKLRFVMIEVAWISGPDCCNGVGIRRRQPRESSLVQTAGQLNFDFVLPKIPKSAKQQSVKKCGS